MHAVWRRRKPVQVVLAVLVAALLASPRACQAQITPLQTAMQAAAEALSRGDAEQAEVKLKQAIALAEATPSAEEDLALSLTQLATVYHGTGRTSEAEPILLRALSLTEKVHGPDHPDVARILGNLGFLYLGRGSFAESRRHFQRAFEMIEAAYGPNYPELILTLNNLGAVEMAEKRYPEAEQHYKRALQIADQASEPVGQYLTVTLRGYATLLNQQGRYDEARELEKRADRLEKRAFFSAGVLIIMAVPVLILVVIVVVLATGGSRRNRSRFQAGLEVSSRENEVSQIVPTEDAEL